SSESRSFAALRMTGKGEGLRMTGKGEALRMTVSLGALLLVSGFALAQERAIPFWPDEVPAAIHAQVDGNAALETVRELGRFHRVHGSPGLAAAAELVRRKLVAA